MLLVQRAKKNVHRISFVVGARCNLRCSCSISQSTVTVQRLCWPTHWGTLVSVHGGLHTSACRACTECNNEQVTSIKHAEKMRCDCAVSVDILLTLMHFELSAERQVYSLAVQIAVSCSNPTEIWRVPVQVGSSPHGRCIGGFVWEVSVGRSKRCRMHNL